METECIPFKETGYFSKLICDYLSQTKGLKNFYHRFPSLVNFKEQITEKGQDFSATHREVLVDALKRQYQGIDLSEFTQENITLLKKKTSFTITTGHQLNLFTGPIYFLYKIVSAIKLSEQLKASYPEYDFIPVYWMASEDHDFEEINHFHFNGHKIQWNSNTTGAVGRMHTEGLDVVLKHFSDELGNSDSAKKLTELFSKAYVENDTLTGATRYLVNTLFGDQGLVIVDGDDSDLKRLLIPFAKRDIFEQLPFKKVSEASNALSEVSKDYKIQVNPREINFFYLKEGLRERIIKDGDGFRINDTAITFNANEIKEELDTYPERFSPNVICRPLYQEVILPNLCYIGGGGELAYWLELKSTFDAMEVPFPILLLRNSVLLGSKKAFKKMNNLQLSVSQLFSKQIELVNTKVKNISAIEIDFSSQKKHLETQFEGLYTLAEKTDKSFLGAVKAQEVKQKKGLDHLEKRLLKAQKRKLANEIDRITQLQDGLFPNQSLQERRLNFSEIYLELGDGLIPLLLDSLDPLHQEFHILEY